MNIEIRQLTHDDFDDSHQLFQYAFQYEISPQDLEEMRRLYKPNETWAAFEDGQIAAQAVLLPLQACINGHPHATGGIASVSSWPEKRRSGHVARILKRMLEQMKTEGMTLSLLAPFSFPFYRKYGWETYVDLKKYELATDQLPARVKTEGEVQRTTALDHRVHHVYEQAASSYNGTLLRSEQWWSNRIMKNKKGHAAIYLRSDQTPGGYVLYQVHSRVLTIYEMVTLDEEARQGLWTYLANHDSMIQKVTLYAPTDDILPFQLDNPQIKTEIIPYFMARIVNIETFMTQYIFSHGHEDISLLLQLEDPHASWNEGCWQINLSKHGEVNLTRLTITPEDAPNLVQCDIQTLTAMMMGYMRPLAMHKIGRLNGSTEAAGLLDSIIPSRTTYLLDAF